MTAITRHKVLFDQSAAGSGNWFRLDTRYDQEQARTLQVDLTSGDTVVLEGTTKDVRGSTPALVTASIEADDITAIGTFTTDGTGDLLAGPWTYIRVTKTGTTGNAKVQGFI